MNRQEQSVPMWLMIFIWVSLLWNLLGVMNFFFQLTADPQSLAQMTEAQRQMHASTPGWLTAVFGVAVISGVIGCGLMMLKRARAVPVLLLSLLAVLLQMGYAFTVQDVLGVLGAKAAILPVVVTLWALALWLLSRRGVVQGWLR